MEFTWTSSVERELSGPGIQLQVLEYSAQPMEGPLQGFPQMLNRPGRWRQLAVHTQGAGATLETGALQYLRGNLEMQAVSAAGGGGGLGGFLRGAVTAAATGEGMFKTAFKGSGVLYTEPTQLHLLLGDLRGESVIIDDGAFVACVGDISVGRHVNQGFAQMMGSGEGRVQPKLTGTGLFALQSPVPPEEFQVLELQNDVLKVDGNLVVAYTDGLQFTVERSGRGLIGSAKTGEGFIQAFRGTGRVWLTPTLPLHYRPSVMATP
ncbi:MULTISPECIES: AIM24 family protein [Deinococcus]|uniref:AIM24 family protein n=1 Tax=Deinococcus cavernae TaxID=2320857 RepID=A0A418VCP4_9DEIO|nr:MULTISPECIES: AIM24 family protein [Deinococcus]RJF73760.1 AIM24 family protein [Deinococcus cavernae]